MAYFLILAASPAPIRPDVVSRLAKMLATDAYSIRLTLKRALPSVLAITPDAGAAESAVSLLSSFGHEAYVIDADQLQGLAEPLRPRTLEFHRDHIRFVLSDREMVLSQWDNLFLLVHGRCRRRVRERTIRMATGEFDAFPHVTEASQESLTEKLDVYFFDGSTPVRIDCDRFSFQFLGTKLGASDSESLATTIRAIHKLAAQAIFDPGFEQFRRAPGFAGRSSRGIQIGTGPGGVSLDRDVDDDAPRFDFYSRLSFLIHLKRAERSA